MLVIFMILIIYTFWHLLKNTRIALIRIVERYNFIQNQTEKCEFDLISKQVVDFDEDLKMLSDEYTWIEYGNIYLGLV